MFAASYHQIQTEFASNKKNDIKFDKSSNSVQLSSMLGGYIFWVIIYTLLQTVDRMGM